MVYRKKTFFHWFKIWMQFFNGLTVQSLEKALYRSTEKFFRGSDRALCQIHEKTFPLLQFTNPYPLHIQILINSRKNICLVNSIFNGISLSVDSQVSSYDFPVLADHDRCKVWVIAYFPESHARKYNFQQDNRHQIRCYWKYRLTTLMVFLLQGELCSPWKSAVLFNYFSKERCDLKC